jgi:hypothetical protein
VACDPHLPVSLLLSDVLRRCGKHARRLVVGSLQRAVMGGSFAGGGAASLDLEDEVGAVLRTGDMVYALPF